MTIDTGDNQRPAKQAKHGAAAHAPLSDLLSTSRRRKWAQQQKLQHRQREALIVYPSTTMTVRELATECVCSNAIFKLPRKQLVELAKKTIEPKQLKRGVNYDGRRMPLFIQQRLWSGCARLTIDTMQRYAPSSLTKCCEDLLRRKRGEANRQTWIRFLLWFVMEKRGPVQQGRGDIGTDDVAATITSLTPHQLEFTHQGHSIRVNPAKQQLEEYCVEVGDHDCEALGCESNVGLKLVIPIRVRLRSPQSFKHWTKIELHPLSRDRDVCAGVVCTGCGFSGVQASLALDSLFPPALVRLMTDYIFCGHNTNFANTANFLNCRFLDHETVDHSIEQHKPYTDPV